MTVSELIPLIQSICINTKIEYCPLTSTYLLYHTELDESYIISSDYMKLAPDSSITLIMFWFDEHGSKGAERALNDQKMKNSPLWKVLNG